MGVTEEIDELLESAGLVEPTTTPAEVSNNPEGDVTTEVASDAGDAAEPEPAQAKTQEAAPEPVQVAVGTEENKEQAKVEPVKKTREQQLERELNEMRTQYAEDAKRQLEGPTPVAPKAPEPAKVEAPPVQQAPAPYVQVGPAGDIAFLEKDEDYHSAFSSRENFNKMLNGVHTKTRQMHMQDASQIAHSIAAQVVNSALKIQAFYTANSDLLQFKDVLQVAADKLVQEKPELAANTDKLLEEVSTLVRARLRLPKPNVVDPAAAKAEADRKKTGLPGQINSAKAKQKKASDFERELEDLLPDHMK